MGGCYWYYVLNCETGGELKLVGNIWDKRTRFQTLVMIVSGQLLWDKCGMTAGKRLFQTVMCLHSSLALVQP